MKLLLPAFLLLAACAQAPQPAASPVAQAPAPTPPSSEECAQASRLARSIMQARQTGATMEQSMAIAKDDALIRELVMRAYTEPHYQTPGMQERVAGDFADETMLACLQR